MKFWVKTILLFAFALAMSFGMWYLLGWFVSGESNILEWTWWGKVIYLILSFGGLSSIVEEIDSW